MCIRDREEIHQIFCPVFMIGGECDQDVYKRQIRKDAKFDKQYLEGKYGADPYLKKIIDWGNVNAE